MNNEKQIKQAVFGGGCFWCLEPIFKNIKGVISVVPGYSGELKENPTYEDVLTGDTGHAEVVKIEYDESIVKYEELLKFFFSIHDPTTPNRQGNDVGTQYRSIILYQDDEQKNDAERIVDKLEKDKVYDNKIVTEIVPLERFYEAEEYHHNYYEKNPDKAYCRLVISPKLSKFREEFGEYLNIKNS